MTYVAPHINAIAPLYQWSAIDNGEVNSNGITVPCEEATTCNWTTMDADLMAFVDAGLNINLLIAPTSEGGHANGATPAYVFGAAYAGLLDAGPQDQVVCGGWTGGSGAPINGSATVSGVWNVNQCTVYPSTTCSSAAPYTDTSGFPVVYEVPFMTAYQAFIAALLKHYSPNGSTLSGRTIGAHMSYVRFGMASAAEDIPTCSDVWPGPVGQAAQPYPANRFNFDAYLAGTAAPPGYVKTMLAAEQASNVSSGNTARAMVVASHASCSAGTPACVDPADTEAALAAQFGAGFGMEALNIGDVYNYNNGQPGLCLDDWCNNFNTYGNDGLMLYLQTVVPNTAPAYSLQNVTSNGGGTALATCSASNPTTCDFHSPEAFLISGNSNPLFNGLFQTVSTQAITVPTITFSLDGGPATGDGGTAETSDFLPTTLPFAVLMHAKALELFSCDLFATFDSNPMPKGVNCSGAPAGITNGPYAAQYRAVITAISGKP
jgi:hypothetical protein